MIFSFSPFPHTHTIHSCLLYYRCAYTRTGLMRKEKVPSVEPGLLDSNITCPQMCVVIYLLEVMDSYNLVSVFISWIIFIIILLLEIFGRYNTPWEVCQTSPASMKTLEISYICNEGISKSVVKAVSSSLQHNGVELWWPVSHLGRHHIRRQWISAGKADCSLLGCS